MRNISSGNLALLQGRQLVARDFLWIVARSFDGSPYPYGFWSGVGDISAPVTNPDTGLPNTRNFEGSGTLIQIGDVPQVANITVQNVTISMSQIDAGVANIVRGHDLKQARIEIYRGLFNPDTRQLVDPAFLRWIGFVDKVTIKTPKENDAGSVEIECASHTQEMTRGNPDRRANDSQRLRSATDNFFEDVTTVGETEFFWGQKAGKVETVASPSLKTKVILSGK
ncbi:hypothetical protein [Phyllobacterium meliloti]|uniref:hypothetical protein n=1 Tax=Phyllobacterium meliloti TaxID=555317 RepID=UPI001D1529DD|nr:hypothetical protein [Phyllobacterium sp. T1293]UGX87129.1 hypothetical protein LLE53_004590 [Phyllobacterium sp. T1293]